MRLGQRHLEDVPRLHVTEAGAAVRALLPAQCGAAGRRPRRRAARCSRPRTSRSRSAAAFGDGGLDVSASQRRMTTGGPIFTAKAPVLLEVREHRVEPRRRRFVRGPVDDRALGQVGEVALDWGSAAAGRARRRRAVVAVEPAERRAAPTRPSPGPAGSCRNETADRRPDVREVLARRDPAYRERRGGTAHAPTGRAAPRTPVTPPAADDAVASAGGSQRDVDDDAEVRRRLAPARAALEGLAGLRASRST